MRLANICSAMLLVAAVPAASFAAPVNGHYETFDNLVSGGPSSSLFGTAVDGDTFNTVFGGGATVGFTNVSGGYPDDAASALFFSSFENNTLQNDDTTNFLGGATAPYAISFALKVDDSDTTGSYVQLMAPGNFISGPGFRTIFQVQLWDADFLSNGDPSYFVVTPFDAGSGVAQFRVAGVPGILEGANGFDDTGSDWNVVVLMADPTSSTLKVWVNPTGPAATPDIDEPAFAFGSPQPPQFLSYAAYTFASDTTPGTEKGITIDSVKVWHNESDPATLFSAIYSSYSTLSASSVSDWQVMDR